MNGCVYKTADGQCEKFSDKNRNTMSWCLDGPCRYETPSNADRIRAMSDEELAEFLDRWEMGVVDYSKTFCSLCDGQYNCHDDCLMDWLKAPVEVDE